MQKASWVKAVPLMTDPKNDTLVLRIEQLAGAGKYEGFNAIAGALLKDKEFEEAEIDAIRRDGEFRNRITDTCQEAWARRHAKAAR